MILQKKTCAARAKPIGFSFFANARIDSDPPLVSVFEAASTQDGLPMVSGLAVPLVGGAAGSGSPFTFINVPFVAAATNGDLN